MGASLLINPASAAPSTGARATPASPLPAAPALTQAQANWEYPNGNQFNQGYNPQMQINSSDIQNLGLSWIYPLPSLPSSLSSLGVARGSINTEILIVNGTAVALTSWGAVFGFNVANGEVLWNFLTPLKPNQTIGQGTGPETLHTHDGNLWFTTATFGSGVHGPTFWFQGGNNRVYAINIINGKEELNFTDFTGLAMVPGNNPQSIYNGVSSSNIIIDQQRGILVSSHDAEIDADNGRGFFAGWNLNSNPPSLAWVSFITPPQPGSGVPLNPNFDTQMIGNMTGAYTFYPGKNGSTNGYTTPWEIAGGVLKNVNDNIVVNWKSLSPAVENASLYNDWGYSQQSQQCSSIDAGGSTGTTGAGWGGPFVLGSGQTSGIVFVPTNNKDPFTGPCNAGPDLWSAAILALNVTTGKTIWGFQANAHDIWDYDCSWWQALANETLNGVNTEVILKTCKNGYLYEINALTGDLIWAWDPPAGSETPGPSRCPVCYMLNPLNASQMNFDFPSAMTNCAPAYTVACLTGPQPSFLQWPSELAGFEDEQSFNPVTNQIYAVSHLIPYYMHYLGENSSTYFTSTNEATAPCPQCGTIYNNATAWDINAATGQSVWSYSVPNQGYRGSAEESGNLMFLTLSSGDVLMLNAQTGKLARDYYIGAPMDAGLSIGASINGTEYIVFAVGTCGRGLVTCVGSTPGDVMALSLTAPTQAVATSVSTTVSTTTAISTSISISTATVSGSGLQPSTVTVTASGVSGGGTTITTYGLAALAAIFIITTGYLAMRGRKPAT